MFLGLQQNIDNLRDFNKNKTIENEDNDYKK